MNTELKNKVRASIRRMYGTDIMEILTISEVKHAIITTKAERFFAEVVAQSTVLAAMAIVAWDTERAKGIIRSHLSTLFYKLQEDDINSMVDMVLKSVTEDDLEKAKQMFNKAKNEPCKTL